VLEMSIRPSNKSWDRGLQNYSKNEVQIIHLRNSRIKIYVHRYIFDERVAIYKKGVREERRVKN
jgi:hypothetical protein